MNSKSLEYSVCLRNKKQFINRAYPFVSEVKPSLTTRYSSTLS